MYFRSIITVLICMVMNTCIAQCQWNNPLPQGNPLYTISFVNHQKGFAMGDYGTILKTDDGGDSWSIVENNVKFPIHKFHFPTISTGYAIGRDYDANATSGHKIILKTTDGGDHWFTIFHDEMTSLRSVWFTSETTGYTAGYRGLIRKTKDGGVNWQSCYSYPSYDLNDIAFFDSMTGIAVGRDGVMLRTTDGGLNWLNVPLDLYYTNIKSISMTGPSSASVFIAGTNKDPVFLIQTNDGGQSWQVALDSLPGNNYLDCGHFPNQDTGFILFDPGLLIRTTNGGMTWDTVHISFQATKLHFINGNEGLAITGDQYGISYQDGGIFGQIWKTYDGGSTWNPITKQVTTAHLSRIEFPTRNTGYAFGVYPQGEILKSTDGGKNWFRPGPGPWTNRYFTTSFFLDEQNGYIGGSGSAFWKTTDGGLTWNSIMDGGSAVCKSISFLNHDTGFVTFNTDVIYRTFDGGEHWTSWKVYKISGLTSLQFLTVDTAFAIGEYESESYVLRSWSGGQAWSKMLTLKKNRFNKIQFFNVNEGYALFNHGLYKTADAGATWICDTIRIPHYGFYDMQFIDPDHGFLIGQVGSILKTTDGGKSWVKMESGTRFDLNSLSLFSPDSLIVAGVYSTIISYDSGLNPGIEETLFSSPSIFSRCYPNPAKNVVNIAFELENCSLVNINLFDLWGRQVMNLNSSVMTPGKHVRTFETGSLYSGIYYYTIRTDKGCETRKVIILN